MSSSPMSDDLFRQAQMWEKNEPVIEQAFEDMEDGTPTGLLYAAIALCSHYYSGGVFDDEFAVQVAVILEERLVKRFGMKSAHRFGRASADLEKGSRADGSSA